MSSETWLRICDQYNRTDLYKLVDSDTPDGVISQQTSEHEPLGHTESNNELPRTSTRNDSMGSMVHPNITDDTVVNSAILTPDSTPHSILTPNITPHSSTLIDQPSNSNQIQDQITIPSLIFRAEESTAQNAASPARKIRKAQTETSVAVSSSQAECPFDGCSYIGKSQRGLNVHKRIHNKKTTNASS